MANIKQTVSAGKPVLNFNEADQSYSIGVLTNDSFAIFDAINLTGGNQYFSIIPSTKTTSIGSVDGGASQQTILQSAGTGVNALRLNASGGGIDIDAVGDINIDATGNVFVNSYAYVTKTSNYTCTSSDEYIGADVSSQAITITLPQISSIGRKIFSITDIAGNSSSNNITISTTGGDTINGNTSLIINSNYSTITLVNDNSTKWFLR